MPIWKQAHRFKWKVRVTIARITHRSEEALRHPQTHVDYNSLSSADGKLEQGRGVELWLHHFLERAFAVPSTDGPRQVSAPFLWRNSLGLEHLHAFFSDASASGLFIRACPVPAQEPTRTRTCAFLPTDCFCGFAVRALDGVGFTDHPWSGLETTNRRQSGLENSGTAQYYCRASLLSFVYHRSAAPEVALPNHERGDPIPLLRSLKCWISDRSIELPIPL